MEYYILKIYEKQKCSELEQGFDRYEPSVKKKIIVCLVTMFVAYAEMILMLLSYPRRLWHLIGGIVCMGAFFLFMRIDSKDQKEHMDRYVDSYKKKLDILHEVLSNEFHIDTKEKIEELINAYQEYVDKRKEEEKRRNAIILAICSSLGSVLSISFQNMGAMGIDFNSWICIAVFLSIFLGIGGIWIYSYKFFDPLKKNYEMMVKDLKDLLLMKF